MRKNETPDESVKVALDELFGLEKARKAATERAVQARAEEEAERERALHEAETHRLRVAEAEARLRLEAERRARSADAERRLEALREELARVKYERASLRSHLEARGTPTAQHEPLLGGRRSRLGRAMVAACLVASVAIVGGIVTDLASIPEVAPIVAVGARDDVGTGSAPASPIHDDEAGLEEGVVEEASLEGATVESTSAAATSTASEPRRSGADPARGRGTGSRADSPASTPPPSMSAGRSLLRDLDACDDDLLCGS